MYNNDDNLRDWSFGYYYNNARYRILDICSGQLLPRARQALIQKANLLDKISVATNEAPERTVKVQDAIDALKLIAEVLETEISKTTTTA